MAEIFMLVWDGRGRGGYIHVTRAWSDISTPGWTYFKSIRPKKNEKEEEENLTSYLDFHFKIGIVLP